MMEKKKVEIRRAGQDQVTRPRLKLHLIVRTPGTSEPSEPILSPGAQLIPAPCICVPQAQMSQRNGSLGFCRALDFEPFSGDNLCTLLLSWGPSRRWGGGP